MNAESATQPTRRPVVATARPASVQVMRTPRLEGRLMNLRRFLRPTAFTETTGLAPQSSYAQAETSGSTPSSFHLLPLTP